MALKQEKMPSLRKRVTTYLRQLSFTSEPRDRDSPGGLGRHRARNVGAGCFITRYLEGHTDFPHKGPPIHHGKTPQDLPDYPIGQYCTGSSNVIASCTGPDAGLAGIQRSRLHLSAGPDIDFIDNLQGLEDNTPTNEKHPQSPTTPVNKITTLSLSPKLIINTSANPSPNLVKKENLLNGVTVDSDSPNNSLTSDNKIESTATVQIITMDISHSGNLKVQNPLDERTSSPGSDTQGSPQNILKNLPKYEPISNRTKPISETVLRRTPKVVNRNEKTQSIVLVTTILKLDSEIKNVNKVPDLIKDMEMKSEAVEESPAVQKPVVPVELNLRKPGKGTRPSIDIRKLKRDSFRGMQSPSEPIAGVFDWKRENDFAFGISTSLYEHNPLIGDLAGQPIADCFGLVARTDGCALALADGVNWGL